MEYSNLTLRVSKSLKMRLLELVFNRKRGSKDNATQNKCATEVLEIGLKILEQLEQNADDKSTTQK